jgi:predicted neuraminidase
VRSLLPPGLFAVAVIAVLVPFAARGDEAWSWRFEVPEPPVDKPGATAYMREEFLPRDKRAPEVHAAAIEFRRDGLPMAVWFGGKREGAADVSVWFSVREPDGWTDPRPIFDRISIRRDLRRHIRRIGNPLLARDGRGNLWLHVVTTSAGGWSASALNSAVSTDEGETWSRVRRHVSAPFLNLGTLLRAPVVHFTDGRVGLPAYHEFFGRFGDLLVLDHDGAVAGRRRMSWGRHHIQPAIAPLSPTRAVALFRELTTPPGRVARSETTDGGRTWTPLEATGLPNPNSGLAVLGLGGETLLVAYNDHETSRQSLALALSDDAGRTFRKVRVVMKSHNKWARFAYPALARRPDGRIQMVYTWNRRRIRSMVFNRAWLEASE